MYLFFLVFTSQFLVRAPDESAVSSFLLFTRPRDRRGSTLGYLARSVETIVSSSFERESYVTSRRAEKPGRATNGFVLAGGHGGQSRDCEGKSLLKQPQRGGRRRNAVARNRSARQPVNQSAIQSVNHSVSVPVLRFETFSLCLFILASSSSMVAIRCVLLAADDDSLSVSENEK